MVADRSDGLDAYLAVARVSADRNMTNKWGKKPSDRQYLASALLSAMMSHPCQRQRPAEEGEEGITPRQAPLGIDDAPCSWQAYSGE